MDVRQLRSFLGLCTYYRKFMKGFSTTARLLHKLTEAKQKFIRTDECNNGFNKLRDSQLLQSWHILKQGNNLFWILMQVMRASELCCPKKQMVRSVSSPILVSVGPDQT
ncbi:hypothetical protein TNCT_328251 [Trichonephila clavata]|uniref:Reverse transcriptase n=1 Tax=Trichonephila clavata TaxID=2740835 RepID=A0A8X6M3Q1_TRICU|nr:hypothetical protein TNCT_328251 [Trichonephila clavata]